MFPANLVNLFIRKGITSETRKVVENIRSSEPSRRVRSGRGNTPGFYPSKKMRVTIQFESHRVELAGIYEKEHDKNVYEYYDQPPPFTINYQINGKNSGRMYHPDFFEISEDFIGYEEWKTEEELIKLSEEKPYLFKRTDDGEWYMPPAEEAAKKLGLGFRVRSSRDLNWVYLSNIRFLEDYLHSENLTIDENANEAILRKVTDHPGICIKELLEEQVGYTSDDIYTLIVSDQIYFDLYKTRITETDRARVYPNKEMALAYSYLDADRSTSGLQKSILDVSLGSLIQWDGRAFVILNVGETLISLLSQDSQKEVELPHDSFQFLIEKGKITGVERSGSEKNSEALERLRGASENDLAMANERYRKIEPLLQGCSPHDINVSERTLRDWVSKYKAAEQLYGYGYIGLLRNGTPGNKKSRFPVKVVELMDTYISEHLETIINRNASSVFRMLIDECQDKGWVRPSFTTFLARIDKRPGYEATLKKAGKKAAYQEAPRYLELELTTPRHGEYPFEICHLDHTRLDIELICSKTKKNLGHPWVTFLVDAFTRRILALYLTFDEPGYRSNMMVLRECVRRHSRLPKTIVVDGGKEFSSTYFETLLAFYKRGKLLREGKPKHGAVIERLFGTTNTMFINNLLGNTQLMKNVRQVTAEVNPKNNAIWPFGKFLDLLKAWAYEIYDTIEHPALGRTPRDEFMTGIANSGKRTSTYTTYDETFIMLTFPTTKKGTAKLDPSNGIKINHIFYWSESLLDPEFAGKQIPVRFDPFNMGVAYAYIRNTWIYMNSEHYAIFVDRSEKEVQQAFEELRRRMRLRGEEVSVTASKVAKFLRSAESQEVLMLQQLRDSEVRSTFTVIDGGKAGSNQAARNNKEKESNKRDTFTVYSNPVEESKNKSTKSDHKQMNKYSNFGEF
ncbi:Mu transposase-like protein [Paenibacillus taihuensis]|uniref:Mu transposase-like protein n=1 Tax=Paenibacillus taihuensis TaxID=1156355 RepID=A0A3D9RYG9_9BACL|nr:Mu transposase C-terminal domain-containing protein [Paenibacillus taihuensis]REE81562.1 Mu transposase-like protein [Paenibacillus taihuensis]